MNYKSKLDSIASVINRSEFSAAKKDEYRTLLDKIRKRSNDPNLYIGIVGDFINSKYSLLNALLGDDFFDASISNASTLVSMRLEYSDTVNVLLKQKTGEVLSYKKNEPEILRMCLNDEYRKLSVMNSFAMKTRAFLHRGKYDGFLLKVLDVATSSQKMEACLDEVVVCHPSRVLKEKNVILFLPGIKSPENKANTLHAVRGVCDVVLAAVPSQESAADTVVNFLEQNLGDEIDKCRFIMDDASAKEQFVDDAKQLRKSIQDKKDAIICKKINRLINLLCDDMKREINCHISNLQEELEMTKSRRLRPLSEFMTENFDEDDVCRLSYVETKVFDTVSSECESLKRYVAYKINRANSKDEVQNVMAQEDVREYGGRCFKYCYNTFLGMLDETRESFEWNLKVFSDEFTKSYGIDAINFEYEHFNDPSWNQAYRFSYDKSRLTTFPVLRYFKSLDSVKQQMVDDVNMKIDAAFQKIEYYYQNKTRKAYSKLSDQMDEVKHLFLNKYQKVISRRIAEGNKMEKTLQSRIDNLQRQMGVIGSVMTV